MRPVTKITVFGRRLAVIVLAAYWLVIFAGTHMPSTGAGTPRVNDTVKHFTAYFLLGALMCYVTTSNQYVRRFGAIALVGMAYGAIDEFTQRFVPGRSPDPMDFLADTAGLTSAIMIYVALRSVSAGRSRVTKLS